MKKLIIKSAHPVLMMLERKSSHAFEVRCWNVEYVAYVDGQDCAGCARVEGKMQVDITKLNVSKTELRQIVKNKFGS